MPEFVVTPRHPFDDYDLIVYGRFGDRKSADEFRQTLSTDPDGDWITKELISPTQEPQHV